MFRVIILFFALLAISIPALADDQEWRFRVFLDDKEIGTHDFLLHKHDDGLLLQSEANFEYRLLFVKLYEYAHQATENWSGNCLTSIESTTDDNGDPFKVSGKLQSGQFVVQGAKGVTEASGCSMTFAYWNPAFLQQERLINIQNGEVLDIQVSEPELVELRVRDQVENAYHYKLEAGKLRIELWYSESGDWLALESEAKGGRRLRYELL